jgi:FtsH-binding integral membrane protein
MKKQSLKSLFNYLSNQFIGRLTGFIIGLWASQLVHHFFTTRSIRNLWGLTAKKTVVSKQTFGNLEWIASVLIGYIVFEMVLRILKDRVEPWLSALRFRLLRRMAERGWKIKRLRMR